MKVEILGSGCAKCQRLYEKVSSLASQHGIEIELSKVTDMEQILDYGVMVTPALVIDGVVKASGRIPADHDLLGWLGSGSV